MIPYLILCSWRKPVRFLIRSRKRKACSLGCLDQAPPLHFSSVLCHPGLRSSPWMKTAPWIQTTHLTFDFLCSSHLNSTKLQHIGCKLGVEQSSMTCGCSAQRVPQRPPTRCSEDMSSVFCCCVLELWCPTSVHFAPGEPSRSLPLCASGDISLDRVWEPRSANLRVELQPRHKSLFVSLHWLWFTL